MKNNNSRIKLCVAATSSSSVTAFIMPTAIKLYDYGFDITIVTSCDKSFFSTCPDFIKVIDYPVGRGFDFKGTFHSAIKFYKLCRKEAFDIVMFTTANAGLYGAFGSKLGGVKCRLYEQWGMRYVGFEGVKRWFIRALEKYPCRCATHILQVSEKNKQLAVADGMYKAEKCTVLGKGGTIGVDLKNYDLSRKLQYKQEIRLNFSIPEDAVVYGFVGRICQDKGIKELFAAFESLSEKHQNVYLMLIGDLDVNSGIDAEVIEKAKANKRIVFVGRVPNVEVVKYLSSCDVLVHPTYREGFGMVLQEAAALELPTITTDIPGASEAIVAGETGLLAKKQDVPSLEDAMEKMLDGELREKFGKAGRARIETDFEREMMVRRKCDYYLSIYNECKNK